MFQHKVNYLGHIVSSEGVATGPSKVEAVQNWPQPRNVHDVRSFLGTCSYYRRFIKGFVHIAKPLHQLAEKNKKFSWSSECEQAFQLLKNALVTSPILGYPSLDEMFIFDTDASAFGKGAVLSQTDGKTERVIAYYSKSLAKVREIIVLPGVKYLQSLNQCNTFIITDMAESFSYVLTMMLLGGF